MAAARGSGSYFLPSSRLAYSPYCNTHTLPASPAALASHNSPPPTPTDRVEATASKGYRKRDGEERRSKKKKAMICTVSLGRRFIGPGETQVSNGGTEEEHTAASQPIERAGADA